MQWNCVLIDDQWKIYNQKNSEEREFTMDNLLWKGLCYNFAKLSSSSVQSSPVELSTALILIISTPTPTHPPPPGIVVMRPFQTT